MSNWRPSSGPDAARSRAAMLDRARGYFAAGDVLAVDTPALGRFAGSDPNIDSFRVHGITRSSYFLHTSPEFCMKRLLAAGYPDIYSICRVYRDGESGKQHLPEFTMLEWYRLGYDLDAIVADTTGLIACCLNDQALTDQVVTLDYVDAFAELADIDVFAATTDDLARAADADAELSRMLGADRDAWLDLVLATVIEPKLKAGKLTVLRHFPASKAALARLCPADQRLADRFEIFFGSTELANGYVELTDAAEQRRRFDLELAKRGAQERSTTPWDTQLLAALDAGLPDCAGVAVGFERLQMIHDRTDDIGDVVTFTSG